MRFSLCHWVAVNHDSFLLILTCCTKCERESSENENRWSMPEAILSVTKTKSSQQDFAHFVSFFFFRIMNDGKSWDDDRVWRGKRNGPTFVSSSSCLPLTLYYQTLNSSRTTQNEKPIKESKTGLCLQVKSRSKTWSFHRTTRRHILLSTLIYHTTEKGLSRNTKQNQATNVYVKAKLCDSKVLHFFFSKSSSWPSDVSLQSFVWLLRPHCWPVWWQVPY